VDAGVTNIPDPMQAPIAIIVNPVSVRSFFSAIEMLVLRIPKYNYLPIVKFLNYSSISSTRIVSISKRIVLTL